MKKILAILLTSLLIVMAACVYALAESVSFRDVDLTRMSDEELADALTAIKTEQKARIKTKVILDKTSIAILLGKSEKIAAEIIDLPEGEKTPKLEWNVLNKAVASCSNGTVKAVKGGSTVITCSAFLADGTYIYEECTVQVNIPVSSVTTDSKTINLQSGDTFTPVFAVKPDNASEKGLVFESSNPDIANVSNTGTIKGLGTGKSTITARTTDGSGKSASITVNVKNDAYMKNMKGKDLFSKIVSGERIFNKYEGGGSDWYDRGADVNGITVEVHSEGENGKVVSVEVLDLMNTKERDVFYKVLECLFSGDDLKKAKQWVKDNLGKTKELQVGDAYIILQQLTNKAPAMYIQDEEHRDWV